MQTKSCLMLRLLIEQFDQGSQDALIQSLPPDTQEQIRSIDTQGRAAKDAIISPLDCLSTMHYSWLEQCLKTYPSTLKAVMVSALPKQAIPPLKALLSINGSLPAISNQRIRAFLLRQLYQKLGGSKPPPLSLIPSSKMNVLLKLEKHRFVELIDLLGIYDLAEKMRHIVDKEKLQAIRNSLSPKRREFLSYCLQQIEKVQVSELDITQWKGDTKQLMNMLHRRGLLRLGKALSGESPALLALLCLKLDTGRGTILKKCYNEQELPNITPLLAEQVLSIVRYLTPKEKGES